MNTIKVTIQDKVAIISLDRGKSNAINEEMVDELQKMILNIEQDENIGGVILTGKEGFFTAGLDLIELYDYDENQIKIFWVKFLDLVKTLTSFKKPLISAISGHSPAGGCVLAITCDYRVMAEGKYIIGLNEVPVGIIVPDSIFELYAFWIGKGKAYQNLLEGKLMGVDEAKNIGLIDHSAPITSLMTAAQKKMQQYIQLPATTWQQTKLNLRKELISKVSEDQTETLDIMLKQWWSPSTRAILKTIIQNLTRKENA
ncbi:MAG: enoyl-CoA hydratase/isomerase family protein [Bacteroidetes bacterium]|nr:enoyl-CoA hydratase/isomerase family protein [Bacteroidota bacterium]MBU1371543.1 enoyl-CoA hydratase/isomerase family protein [Bacteroidota bacterium]MBU1486125.1 enoyl-CoA hydratase/isomerase family protein [Bacteroidota bacterium]MBU1759764.1 enoyl-CoA hydratase/isomerase family protein [Bacteroidota bacterium]MBU2376207.1 enoyl-CoA hydratase/isomerase family protein [Bacteroidota bacterium]